MCLICLTMYTYTICYTGNDYDSNFDLKRFAAQFSGIQSVSADNDIPPELQLVFYTGHTLQGNYKGMCV